MDLIKIASACAVECVRQHVGLDRVAMLIEGYNMISKINALSLADVLDIARVVEPTNRGEFRCIPVTFANGGGSVNSASIPRAMVSLFSAIDDLTVDEFVREFLYIHPFSDGNGRTGFLLYNFLRGTLDSPLALPDYNW